MHLYVIYDENTGEVLQTHATYLLGQDEPVASDENEVLALAREDFGEDRPLAVTTVPDDFDPRDRTTTLAIDRERRCAIAVDRPVTKKNQS